MAGKKCKVKKQSKRKLVRATIEVKKDLISKYENGIRVCELATMFNMPKSTVCTIIKNKAVIKAADVAKGVTTLTVKRSKNMEEMEKLLLIWITEKQLAGEVISEAMICEKAKTLHDDLVKDLTNRDDFKASRGWFDKFKKRSGIHSVFTSQEAVSSNNKTSEKFVIEFKEFVEKEGYNTNRVFNCDQMSLVRKKVPRKTFITKEEISASELKPMKDNFTLLFCDKASEDSKTKPLLVCHSENPRIFGQSVCQVDDHTKVLATEELQHLHLQQKEEIAKEVSSAEENAERVSNAEIHDLLILWAKTQEVVEKWHPDIALVNRCINLFNDNIIEYFRKIKNGHQYQSTLEHWLSTTTSSSEPSTSGERLQCKTEKIPDIIIESDSSSTQ